MPTEDAKRPSSLARAALHSLPLALLAAGGVVGALTSWMVAAAGALAYLIGVAVTAGKGQQVAEQVQQLGEGQAPAAGLTTLEGELEQMDHLVRGLSEAMRG